MKYLFMAGNVHGRYILDNKARFSVKRCLRCDAVCIDDVVLDDSYYAAYYPHDYYPGEKVCEFLRRILGALSLMSFKNKESLILHFLKPKPADKIRILDVGCGRGDFLDSLDDTKFEKFGIEVNRQGYEACLHKKIAVSNTDLKTSGFQEASFDVVTLWHVLEHLQDPIDTLTSARKLLRENGLLIFSTPDTDSLGFRHGKNLWFHLDAPRHLVLFGIKSVSLLLEKTGFDIVGRRHTFLDYPLDLFWSLRRSFWMIFVYPLYPLLRWITPETMMLICKKR